MAEAEHPLRDRYLRLGQSRQIGIVLRIRVVGAAPWRPKLDQVDLGDGQRRVELAQRHIQRVGRPLRWLAADVASGADSAFPSPPRTGAVVRRAGLAVENTGVILTGQRNVVLAVGID